jgi:peptide/nickel transport system substrate-binding protein
MARTQRPAARRTGEPRSNDRGWSRRQFVGGAAGLGAAAALGVPFPTLAGATAAVKAGSVTRAAVLQSEDSRITVVQNIDTNTLDPQFHNDPVSLNLALHLFDTPFILDQEANVIPRFLESYENIDELTWEFRLPQGASFHNGEPVNAESVRYSIERIATGDPPVPDPFIGLSSYSAFETLDEYTFRLITASPAPTLPGLMTKLWILPPQYFTETPFDDLQSNPVGSGPYRFVEWVPDDHITLVANEEYWAGAPSIKEIVFRPVSELSTRVALLQSGEADVITNVAPDQAALLEESDDTKVSQAISGRIIFVGMRTDVAPLDDVRVRRAFNHAVDFDTINEQILNGIGQRAATITTPRFANPELQPIAYDPELARSLLQEAGVEGLSLTMDSHTGVFLKDIEIAQAIAQNLQEIGVEVEVQPLDSSV